MTDSTAARASGLRLVDSHAHLELEPLVNDPAGVVQRATDAGVIAVITVGIDLLDAVAALEIAEAFDNVFAAVGFHPHNAKDVTELFIYDMERTAGHPKVVAYGEIGLDFYRNLSPASIQRSVFYEQLHLAKGIGKPVVIHLRDAYVEGLDLIEKVAPFPAGGVVHCFSGDADDAVRVLDLGFHISIPGTVTYRKNDKLRSIVKDLPPDRILLETDCPFLSPEPLRGKTNEPAHIVHTAAEVARIRGVSLTEIAEITTRNAVRLFGLPLGNGA
jgi:TatD DNase family protein